jgi:hypothetical protein
MAETPYAAYFYLKGPFMDVIKAFAQDAVDRAEPLTVAAAYAQCRDAALAESAIGAIGLEIESHLVDLDHVADPVPWKRVEAIAAMSRSGTRATPPLTGHARCRLGAFGLTDCLVVADEQIRR